MELAGSIWDGRQLEASTYNGGITVAMTAGYSAHVPAETERGHIQSDLPTTVIGERDLVDWTQILAPAEQ